MTEFETSVAGVRHPVVQFAPSDIARRQIATWNGIQADAVELIRRERFEYGFKAPQHLLIMCERLERNDGETRIEGLPESMLHDASKLHEVSNKLSLVPGGHRFSGWQNPRGLARVNYFYIDPLGPLVDPELRFAEIEFKPRFMFFDRDLWATALKLKEQAQHPEPAQRQYAEALGTVLIHELLRLNNGAAPVKQNIRGGLAGWQEKKVAHYIEEHLAEDISLPALADVARLSPYHFARTFKQSFGLPPHRYLTSRRIEKAKGLLAKPTMSVTQIGFELGFSEISSFTTAFRKHAGLSPTEYRRSL
jgi:AraC family transcriptional regulator